MAVKFELRKVEDEGTGVLVDTLMKITTVGEKVVEEAWGSVLDFDKLFNACVARWEGNWDIDKVCTTIRETTID
jgi:hypothetical protein